MLSFLIHTLGCKLNQLESEAFNCAFRAAGFIPHDSSGTASPSLVIINACTVTSKADQKARRVIRKALRDYPDSCVLVTGCYARLNHSQKIELDAGSGGRLFMLRGKEALLDLPRYINEKENIYRAVKALCENSVSINDEPQNDQSRKSVFQFSPEHFSSHTRSFLKIQDGCDNHCTYCRIRLARGSSVSLDAEQALARLQNLEENHAEAVLTGVNISQYHDEKGGVNLGELLEYLLAGTKKICLRLSSLTPDIIDENFSKILSNKRIRPHFHLSIQSGSKTVLEKMGRGYNEKIIEKAAALLRSVKDDPFLACDIIAGFPGETEVEFNKTFELCKKIDFAWIHVFPYSKRPGTPAWSFPGAVQEKEISKRVQTLTNLAKQGRLDYARRWLGRDVDVLIERNCGVPHCRGTSDNYLKLNVQYKGEKAPLPGAVLRCRIPANQKIEDFNEEYDVIAEENTEG